MASLIYNHIDDVSMCNPEIFCRFLQATSQNNSESSEHPVICSKYIKIDYNLFNNSSRSFSNPGLPKSANMFFL